jgi:hypothetical protein
MSTRSVAALAAALFTAVALSGCSTQPSTRAQVCTTFGELGDQFVKGNGIIGNPLFHKADDLSDIAGRYAGSDLSADAKALHKLAKSDSVTGLQLMNATSHIAQLCGHPLAVPSLFGN